MDENELMVAIASGEIPMLDPLRPRKYHNSLRSRVATVAARFDKWLRLYPGGFVVDRGAVLRFLESEKVTKTARDYFKQYGYKLKVSRKKSFIQVTRWEPKNENSDDRGKPDAEHGLRDTKQHVGRRDGEDTRGNGLPGPEDSW